MWTPLDNATSIYVMQALQDSGQMPEMSDKSKRSVHLANLAQSFSNISREASMSNELCEIANSHMRAMELEFAALRKARRNKNKKVQYSPQETAIEQIDTSSTFGSMPPP